MQQFQSHPMIEHISVDILSEIASHLGAISLFKLLATCKQLWKLRTTPVFQERLEEFQTALKEITVKRSHSVMYHIMILSWDDCIRRHHSIEALFIANKMRKEIETFQTGDEHLLDISKACFKMYWNQGLECALAYRNMELVVYFRQMGADFPSFTRAAYEGHRDAVERCIANGANIWNDGMRAAACGGHLHLIEFFMQKGADDWNGGLEYAALGGHKEIVEFFVQKGARAWNSGMTNAASTGHKDLVEFFLHKGFNDWNLAMCHAAAGGHLDIVEFFVQKGANNWDQGSASAAAAGQLHVLKYFSQKGANDWNDMLFLGSSYGHKQIVEWSLQKGADNLNYALYGASYQGHKEIVEFLIQKGANEFEHLLESLRDEVIYRNPVTLCFDHLEVYSILKKCAGR